MIGRRAHGWMILIGLLVVQWTGSASGQPGLFGETLPGDYCCMEDWEEFMREILSGFKIHAANLTTPAFKDIMDTWVQKVGKFREWDPQLEGVCQGRLQYKCVGVKNLTKCECNNDAPFAFVLNQGKTDCIAEKEGSLCIEGGPKPTTCDKDKGLFCRNINAPTNTGLCKKPRIGTGKPGETDGGGNGTKVTTAAPPGARAAIESRVLWIVVPGLALLFSI